MNILYFVVIGLCGLVMMLSPNSFLGKAKYDEDAVKTESLIKKGGIFLIIFSIVLIILDLVR